MTGLSPLPFLLGEEEVSHELILESDDPIVYEDDNATISATKNASLRGNNFLLLANRITWNRISGDTTATGSVSLTKEKTRILADELKLSTISGDFIATNSRGGEHPMFFTSEIIERNASIDTLKNNRLYVSEPGIFEPNLGTNLYSRDKNSSTVTISPSIVRIGDVIVGILPSYTGKKRSGLWGIDSIIKFGKDIHLGWYGETALSHQWNDFTASSKLTYFRKKGVLISPQLTHTKRWDEGFMRSTLNGSWIDDQSNEIGLDARNIPLSSQRSFTHFKNISRFNKRWRSSTIVEWESDSEVIRDFKRSHFYRNQWNQNHNEISYEGNGYTISMLSRWQANDHESIVEELPLLSIDSGPNPVDIANLYHSSTLNFSKLNKRNNFGAKVSSAESLNLGYKIERPMRLMDGIIMTPSVAFLIQDFKLPEKSFSRSYNDLGIDFHASMHQHIPYQNKMWEISQLTHVMKITSGFRQTELLAGNSLDSLDAIYSPVEDLNLAPLDILDSRNNHRLGERQLIRLGWENYILGKWQSKSRSLLSMRTYYDISLKEPGGIKREDFLYSVISIDPIYWLSLDIKQKLDLKTGKNYRQSYALKFTDGRFQGASISYNSYLDYNHYSYLTAWKRLNEKVYSSLSASYDLDKNYLSYWRGNLEYRAGSNWILDFSISQRKGTWKEDSTEWSIGLRLHDFRSNRLTETDKFDSINSM